MGEATPEHREQRRNGKSEAAFRTISEVADELEVPQHVLRFWETKFSQIRPMKRGGGRRYYRPEDVALLRRIRGLLYDDGFTIKGVQKLLREGAIKPQALKEDTPPPKTADLIAAVETQSKAHGLSAEQKAVVEDVIAELGAVRDMLAQATKSG